MICNGRKQLFKALLLSLEGAALFSAVAEAVCSVPVSASRVSVGGGWAEPDCGAGAAGFRFQHGR